MFYAFVTPTFLNGQICGNGIAIKQSKLKKTTMALYGKGKVLSCASAFNFFSAPLDGIDLASPQNGGLQSAVIKIKMLA